MLGIFLSLVLIDHVLFWQVYTLYVLRLKLSKDKKCNLGKTIDSWAAINDRYGFIYY